MYWWLGITVFVDNLGSNVRFFNDDFDRVIFAQRGTWALEGLVPYRGVFSEYPHVATYVLGLPYLFVGGDYAAYRAVFSLLMCVALGAVIVLLRRMLPGRESLAYLMLLPAPLYFTINRFDIVATLFVVLGLRQLQKGRDAASGACLGIAALTKWYPLALLPLIVSYISRRGRPVSAAVSLPVAFAVTCVAIVLPSLAGAGFRAVLRPYAFHAGRGLEMVSLPALVQFYASQWIGVVIPPWLVGAVCLGGVAAAVAASLRAHVDSMDDVLSWSVVILATSILLSTVWSPQWMLWVLPLMILIARTTGDVAAIVAYGVVSYLVFPLIHDSLHGLESVPVRLGSFAVSCILIRTVVVAYRRAAAAPQTTR